MNEESTITKTKIKTSTKAVLGFIALGAVAAGFFLVLKAPTVTLTTSKYVCEDSDGGNNKNLRGYIQIKNPDAGFATVTSAEDYCLGTADLKEHFCSTVPSVIYSSIVPCNKPGCKDGACLPPAL